jgi:hypothetical protein
MLGRRKIQIAINPMSLCNHSSLGWAPNQFLNPIEPEITSQFWFSPVGFVGTDSSGRPAVLEKAGQLHAFAAVWRIDREKGS